jgi:hypothetical protein
MTVAIRKRGAQARAGHSRARVALACGVFIALLAAAGLAGHGFSIKPNMPPPGSQYRGIVQLAPGHGGECERFELDNRTGILRPQTQVPCGATTGASPQSTEAVGPLTGVRRYFKPD